MNPRELEWQIQELLEGQLDGDAFDEHQERLRQDPEAQEVYREYVTLQHCLKYRSKGTDMLNVVPMEKIVQRNQWRAMKQAMLATAAVLLLCGIIMTLVMAQGHDGLLAFKTSPGSKVVVSHMVVDGDQPRGQVMDVGSQLTLTSGSVELEFKSGVRSIIQAPAELTLINEGLLDMKKGTGWFNIPSGAEGFQVRTSKMVLTDLGTTFGIITNKDQSDEAHTFEGEVKLLNRIGSGDEQHLIAGQARRSMEDGSWKQIDLNRDAFLSKLPEKAPHSVEVMDRATFTSSPNNEQLQIGKYTLSHDDALHGFKSDPADKLVVTVSHENGTIAEVTYGGVRMSLAIHGQSTGGQQCWIYYLDSPGPSADLVITGSGSVNGVGGSLISLSNTAPGPPVVTHSSSSESLSLTSPPGFLVAAHASNSRANQKRNDAKAPMVPVFSGPTGSSLGGSGFLWVREKRKVVLEFESTKIRPVTAAATFKARS